MGVVFRMSPKTGFAGGHVTNVSVGTVFATPRLRAVVARAKRHEIVNLERRLVPANHEWHAVVGLKLSTCEYTGTYGTTVVVSLLELVRERFGDHNTPSSILLGGAGEVVLRHSFSIDVHHTRPNAYTSILQIAPCTRRVGIAVLVGQHLRCDRAVLEDVIAHDRSALGHLDALEPLDLFVAQALRYVVCHVSSLPAVGAVGRDPAAPACAIERRPLGLEQSRRVHGLKVNSRVYNVRAAEALDERGADVQTLDTHLTATGQGAL